MIIKNLNQITDDVIKHIISDYDKNILSVKKLSKKYQIDYNVILSILNGKVSNEELASTYINQDKFIIISDTHIGSELEKIKYLDIVYNYAIKNRIRVIVHAGDLIQSTMRPVQKELIDDEKQLNYLVKKYPFDKRIKNYILFGNHDYHTLSKNDEYLKIIDSRKDFNILGFKNAYFMWCEKLINVSHPIEHYKIVLPSRNSFLRIVGHKHSMSIKQNYSITVPSLSLDVKPSPDTLSLPGFLVVKKEDDMMNVYHYVFFEKLCDLIDKMERLLLQNNNINFDNMGIVLSRKLSDNKRK